MPMTNAEFSQKASRLAAHAASWAADTLDLDPSAPADAVTIGWFVQHMRERLDYIAARAMPGGPVDG